MNQFENHLSRLQIALSASPGRSLIIHRLLPMEAGELFRFLPS